MCRLGRLKVGSAAAAAAAAAAAPGGAPSHLGMQCATAAALYCVRALRAAQRLRVDTQLWWVKSTFGPEGRRGFSTAAAGGAEGAPPLIWCEKRNHAWSPVSRKKHKKPVSILSIYSSSPTRRAQAGPAKSP